MNVFEAALLGILQGLAEFLPISSSGHLELAKVILNLEQKENLTFVIAVHGATVLSTIIIFFTEIRNLLTDSLQFKWNESTQYIAKIAISMIPVLFVGFLLKDFIETLFTGNLLLTGSMLILTAALLAITYFRKTNTRELNFIDSFIIGIAQALAVLPGLSRSGSTIATGVLLGIKKEEVAKFSFLMVLIPILGENILGLLSGEFKSSSISTLSLIVGFITTFITGLLACRWMINLVKKGKLIWFAIYCFIIGIISIIFA